MQRDNDIPLEERGISIPVRIMMFVICLPMTLTFAGATILCMTVTLDDVDRFLGVVLRLALPAMAGAGAWMCAAGTLASVLPKPTCHNVTVWMVGKLAICSLWIGGLSIVVVIYSIIMEYAS